MYIMNPSIHHKLGQYITKTISFELNLTIIDSNLILIGFKQVYFWFVTKFIEAF
jgi:hypothetical protein